MYNIFLDLDGTVADFWGRVGFLTNREDRSINWSFLSTNYQDLYKDLDPLQDMPELMKYLASLTSISPVKVLTALPSQAIFKNVTFHKRAWVKQYLDPLLGYEVEVLFGPYSIDKQFHCKSSHDILIDDNSLCIEQWRLKGGIGILHTRAKTTIEELKKINSLV